METQLPFPKRGRAQSPLPEFSAHVYCGQRARWIRMPLGMKVYLGLGHIVLDGDPAPPKKGHSPHFSAHVYCGQTAGWIKMPLGTKVGLGPGHNVCYMGIQPANFRRLSIVAKRSPISAAAEHLLRHNRQEPQLSQRDRATADVS